MVKSQLLNFAIFVSGLCAIGITALLGWIKTPSKLLSESDIKLYALSFGMFSVLWVVEWARVSLSDYYRLGSKWRILIFYSIRILVGAFCAFLATGFTKKSTDVALIAITAVAFIVELPYAFNAAFEENNFIFIPWWHQKRLEAAQPLRPAIIVDIIVGFMTTIERLRMALVTRYLKKIVQNLVINSLIRAILDNNTIAAEEGHHHLVIDVDTLAPEHAPAVRAEVQGLQPSGPAPPPIGYGQQVAVQIIPAGRGPGAPGVAVRQRQRQGANGGDPLVHYRHQVPVNPLQRLAGRGRNKPKRRRH